jgi:hypothetical protein
MFLISSYVYLKFYGIFAEVKSNRGGMGKKAKKCTKIKDGNERSCTNSNHNENPSFTLTLPRSYVEGDKLKLVCFPIPFFFLIVNSDFCT